MQRHSSKMLAVLLLAGVFVPLAWWQGRPTAPPVEPEEPRQNIFQLAPGECFDAPSADRLIEVVPIACEDSHDYEVFAVAPSIADAYDEGTLATEANTFCVDMFNRYTGRPLGADSLEVVHLIPTEASWDQGLTRFSCALYDAAGPTVGSQQRS